MKNKVLLGVIAGITIILIVIFPFEAEKDSDWFVLAKILNGVTYALILFLCFVNLKNAFFKKK